MVTELGGKLILYQFSVVFLFLVIISSMVGSSIAKVVLILLSAQ